ncbi:hypothetical protein Ga0466249_004321 [Sporomusaceae bacterium BoRhaA]|uniref:hypothetical protein n=1 Tax=Pelorhabdus rhamnosifermentans TaxID=2772457 RepID=UPI001C062F60|nr:hypothetical protein [Pelorhabdus rhamnosifermentans]MBU2703185.1 hypothetical protein [Pelorhabdus rhamnosifermentans]
MRIEQLIKRLQDKVNKLSNGVVSMLTLQWEESEFKAIPVRITLGKKQSCLSGDIVKNNEQVNTLVELLNNPAPNRNAQDFGDK